MVDEGLHDGVAEISFSAMFRERMKNMPPEPIQRDDANKTQWWVPDRHRVVGHGTLSNTSGIQMAGEFLMLALLSRLSG